jgi:hypothetical protein
VIDLLSTTVNRPEPWFQFGLPPDPGSIFGGLLAGCIRDDYLKDDNRFVAESALFLVLGAVSSLVTTYLLSAVGVML